MGGGTKTEKKENNNFNCVLFVSVCHMAYFPSTAGWVLCFLHEVCVGFGFVSIISCSESFSVSTFRCETTIEEVLGLLLLVAVCQPEENDTDIM